ncbi:MAG TPA: glycosyltransferase family 9 protein [Bacteroidota bacterium]|jgi:heptosyltransferase-2|nr:glycosyltransferase family 9 protein [Bacteroidota bacterium]
MILLAVKDQQRSLFAPAEKFLKNNCMGLLEKLYARKVVSPESVDLSNIRSILVIRQHDQLGDFLLATPVLRALRERFPEATIGLLVREYFHDVARALPTVDDVLVFYENGLHWTWRRVSSLHRSLRKGWDLTVVLNSVSHSLTSDLLAHFSRAKYVLGSDERIFPGCSRNFFYNLLAPQGDEPRHQTERNLDIVRLLGVDTLDRTLRISISEEERNVAGRFLEAKGFKPGITAIGMHIGAGKPLNRWPVKRFAELAKALTARYAAQIVLFWGPYEEELKRIFHAQAETGTVDAGHSNLRMLASLFARCDAIVCNDTGIMHLGAATGVPVAALFGSARPEEWKPFGDNVRAIRAESGKVEDIRVEDVMVALEGFI